MPGDAGPVYHLRLSARRAANQAPTSGLDAMLMNQIQLHDDPVRFTENVSTLCDELEARVKVGNEVAPADAPCVRVSGCPMSIPNWKVPHVLETSGAVVAFGAAALSGREGVRMNSMCAVFAEPEDVGLMTRGEKREDIARAVHASIARRTAAMLHRLAPDAPLLFAGGAARNACLVRLIRESLRLRVHVPNAPQMAGALGAALLAAERV